MAKFDLTRSDFFSASWFLQRHRRLRAYLGAVLIMFSGVMILSGRWMSLGSAFVVAGAGAGLIAGLWLLSSRQKILRVYDDHLARASEYTLTLNECGFVMESRNSLVKVAWGELKLWSENDRFFFLYQGIDFAHVIPIASLSEDEVATIRKKTVALKDV